MYKILNFSCLKQNVLLFFLNLLPINARSCFLETYFAPV